MDHYQSKPTEEILWEMARAIERIEHALLPTDFNGKRGLVKQVNDLESRVDDLETYRIKCEEIEMQREVSRKKRNEIITAITAIVGTAIAAITIYLSIKK